MLDEEVMTFRVQKQLNHKRAATFRYRYRISGVDYSLAFLSGLKKFKLTYSGNMNPDDIKIVEKIWRKKLC